MARMTVSDIPTPALVARRGAHDAEHRADARAASPSSASAFRPHVKTCKSIEVVRRMMPTPERADHRVDAEGSRAVLRARRDGHSLRGRHRAREAPAGGRSPGPRLRSVGDPRQRRGRARRCRRSARARRCAIPVLIEIDSDDHRGGVKPESDRTLLPIGRALTDGAALRGVMTHAGGVVRLPFDRRDRRDGRAGARGGRPRGRAAARRGLAGAGRQRRVDADRHLRPRRCRG